MKKIINTVSVNNFVKRQVKNSGKTYSESLTFENLATHAQEQLQKGLYTLGYRNGVILVDVSKKLIKNFICPFVKITKETNLIAKLVKRRPEENYYIQIRALNGKPLKIGSVQLILYHHSVLIETNEHSSNSDWELISFHAIPKEIKTMPMGPITMMRNQLQLPGGTKAFYKSEEWAESVNFWQNYAVLKSR